MSYHGRIMNIPVTRGPGVDLDPYYKFGHRDARHAAAEIANEADAVIAVLLEALEESTEVLVGEYEGYYSYCSVNGEVPDHRDRDELERRMERINANKAAIRKAKS